MSQSLKLAIADVVEVQVKFAVRSNGVDKKFAPTLIINRVNLEDDDSRSEQSIKDFMRENVIGWKDQRLVLNADDQPAEFSAEALEMFFKVQRVCMLSWSAYVKEIGAKEKN